MGEKLFAETGPGDERIWNPQAGGWETPAKCPQDGLKVVYNGNYFCENWAYPAGPGECDWALPGDHPITRPAEIAVCYAVGIDPKTGGLLRDREGAKE